jgi:serine/threonine protein kinase
MKKIGHFLFFFSCISFNFFGLLFCSFNKPQKFEEFKKNYEVGEELGQGRFGTVFLAKNKTDPNNDLLSVAIKRSSKDLVIHEYRMLEKCGQHENIVGCRGCYKEKHPNQNTDYYLVLEYISGETLFDKCCNGPFEENELKKIIFQIVRAFMRLHDLDIIHLDFKEDNVMVTKDGIVKIIDLGSSVEKTGNEDSTFCKCPRQANSLRHNAPEISWYSK